MAYQILHDGSLLFRLEDRNVLFHVPSQSVLIEDTSQDPSEADTAFGRPFAIVQCIQITSRPGGRARVSIELMDDRVHLALLENEDQALQVAWAVGDLTQSDVHLAYKPTTGPVVSSEFLDEMPTQRISFRPLSEDDIEEVTARTKEEIRPSFDEAHDTLHDWDNLPSPLTDVYPRDGGASEPVAVGATRESPPRRFFGRRPHHQERSGRPRRQQLFRAASRDKRR